MSAGALNPARLRFVIRSKEGDNPALTGGDVKTRRLLRLIPALGAAAALALSAPGVAGAKHKHHHHKHHHHHNGQSSTPGYMY